MALDVTAIVVLHRPDPALLERQYRAVMPQVDALVYVDNGQGREALARWTDHARAPVTVLGDGTNVGLAAALNVGLSAARATASRYALLLDQDSVPDPGVVGTLVRGVESDPEAIAAGPAIRDEHTGRVEDFTRLRIGPNKRIRPGKATAEFFHVDFLITSGTLLRLALLDRSGLMDEDLFIDCIDFDWSFRARSRGLRLLATYGTTLAHRRGDEVRVIPGGLRLRVHSPARLYYMHRNRVRLYRRDYVPVAWKVHDVARLVVKLAVMLVFLPDRGERAAAALRGIRDGLR